MDVLNLDLPGVGESDLMPACAARAAAHRAEVEALACQVAALQAQVTCLRLELGFYADRDNWKMCRPNASTYHSRAHEDGGHRARKALEKNE